MSVAIPMSEGFIPFDGRRTWYRVLGDRTGPAAGRLPVLMLHGGPGMPHDCLEPLEVLAQTGRPVVLYDQQGCGDSDVPDDPATWTLPFFVAELAAVRVALGLDRVHLLGFSWGGTLAMEYALTQPAGLVSLVLHSASASERTFKADINRAYDTLPPDVRATLRAHEAAGTTDDPAYRAAQRVFDVRYVCRIDPWPPFLERTLARWNPAVGRQLYSVDPPVGARNWEVMDRLAELRVPTLITAGRHDGLAPDQHELLHAGIRGSELVLFEESSHYAHAEEPARYLATLEAFLGRVDPRQRGS
jgi:proline-specific peptidase